MAKAEAKEIPDDVTVGDQVTYRLPDHWLRGRAKDTNPYRVGQVTDVCWESSGRGDRSGDDDGKVCVDIIVFIGVQDGGPNQDVAAFHKVQYDPDLAPGTFDTNIRTDLLGSVGNVRQSQSDSGQAQADKGKKKADKELPRGNQSPGQGDRGNQSKDEKPVTEPPHKM